MNKKLSILLAMLALVGVMLVGCGNKDDVTDTKIEENEQQVEEYSEEIEEDSEETALTDVIGTENSIIMKSSDGSQMTLNFVDNILSTITIRIEYETEEEAIEVETASLEEAEGFYKSIVRDGKVIEAEYSEEFTTMLFGENATREALEEELALEGYTIE